MKLKFTKNKNEEILLTMNGKEFDTNDYLEIVKNIKDDKKIELEDFDETISPEEQESIKEMIKEINLIGNNDDNTEDEESNAVECPEEDINPENIPF